MYHILEKISLTLILLKIFDIYFFCYLATNEKIAITHLWHAIEPQTMYHVIAKDKVAEQHISRKNCNCNTFRAMSPLLKVEKKSTAAILLTPVAAILFFRIRRKRFPGKFFQ